MSTQSAYLDRVIAEKKSLDARVAALVAQREELSPEVFQALSVAILEDRAVLVACVADYRRQHPRHTETWA